MSFTDEYVALDAPRTPNSDTNEKLIKESDSSFVEASIIDYIKNNNYETGFSCCWNIFFIKLKEYFCCC